VTVVVSRNGLLEESNDMKLLYIAGVALLSTACVTHGRAVLDPTPNVEGVGGTIAGAVRASGDTSPLLGRKVTATNEQTGATFFVSTATNGGYTMKVPAGKYRLEVELRPGESLESRPEPTDVNVGDLDPDRDFVLTVRR
jgi:hypothetical protein